VEKQKVETYILTNQKYFPPEKMILIKEKLEAASDDRYLMLASLDLKDPTVILIISIFLGSLGIDRFMMGDIGLGVLKLLTFGVCGIMTIVDWFLVMNRTRELNFNKIMLAI